MIVLKKVLYALQASNRTEALEVLLLELNILLVFLGQ